MLVTNLVNASYKQALKRYKIETKKTNIKTPFLSLIDKLKIAAKANGKTLKGSY
jgi:hypothetical protein